MTRLIPSLNMPSLINRFRKSKKAPLQGDPNNSPEQDNATRKKPETPEFKLFRQATDEDTPTEVDVFRSSGLPHAIQELTISEDRSPAYTSRASASTPSEDSEKVYGQEHEASTGLTPTRSMSKRLSGRLFRRPSQMSRSSRSSSYVPDFKPIDRTADIEAQWEERATMLAQAGPPSPALPRSDSIFHIAGPPQIPAIKFGTYRPANHNETNKRLSARLEALGTPEQQRPTAQRQLSSASAKTKGRSIASASSEHESQLDAHASKDDLLQHAIREHELGNLEKAAQLFKRSATGDDGLAIGQLMYGLSLRHGWGLQRDEVRAIHWLRLAASSSAQHEREALSSGLLSGGNMKGDLILAIFELGNCFRHGWGVDVDKDLARNYYETAANLGDSDAMYETAWCYETGFGMKKNKYKAAFWYRKSEKSGNKIPGMQWIWKPKYDVDPFLVADDGAGTADFKKALAKQKTKT